MSHIWMSHVIHMNESCQTYEWVMSHIWMSHVTHMNESCHTHESGYLHVWHDVCDMNQPHVWHDSFICVPWLIPMCAMTHPYVCHDSSICVTWLRWRICSAQHAHIFGASECLFHQRCVMSRTPHSHTHSYLWHDSFSCVTWLIPMCDMTHSYVWHESFLCVTWLIHMCDMTYLYVFAAIPCCRLNQRWCVMSRTHTHTPIPVCDMTHSYVWHDSFICVIWLIHTCDMTHLYVFAASPCCLLNQRCTKNFKKLWCVMSRTHTHTHTHSCVWHDSFICVTWLIPMCDMTHSYVWHDSSLGIWRKSPPFESKMMCHFSHIFKSCHTYE